MKLKFFMFSIAILTSSFCDAQMKSWRSSTENADYIHRAIKEVTDVMVYDIYSPPVASRTYAYISVAGYEAAIRDNREYRSLAGQLHQLKPLPAPDPKKEYSFTLASVQAILSVGKELVISEQRIQNFRKKSLQEFRNEGMPENVFKNSVEYGEKVAAHILAWAAKDNYKETRSLPKYSVSNDPAYWKPTPPAYFKAVEPNWNKIRTFVIDSMNQFKPAPATKFSTGRDSRFYQEALEVRNIGDSLTDEQKEIANFWDCNPFKMNVRGHVMFATKKISPGGHWVNITRLACKKVNADVARTAEAYACLSVAISDAFVSCWDEKYRSNVIRPETYINQYINGNWLPLLQTPPFPEYTSGHSVVSSSAAVVLTKMFGDNFSFTDSSEFEFGLPARSFVSFNAAAQEAAISRFYGGIHYMPSINNGLVEGTAIGKLVVSSLRTRK